MKKTIYSMLVLLTTAFTFSSCEDVPMPYEDPNNDTDIEEPTVTIEPTGSGTLEDPFNVAGIIAQAEKLSTGESSSQQYYFKGIITAIKEEYTTNYGNGTYYISDDASGTNEFYVYRAYYLGNKKFAEGDTQINVGDEVIVCGTITNYNGTLETSQNGAYLYSLNGSTGITDTPVTDDILKPADGVFINESFASSFGVFTAKTVKGTAWVIDYSTAKATGYDSSAKSTTPSSSYLVSKPMDMSGTTSATISFEYILRYYTSNGTVKSGVVDKVLITSNYTDDPTTTTWTDITGSLTEGSDWTTFYTYSAAVPSEFLGQGKVVVALYYACEENSATWEVKNFKVAEGTSGGEQGGETGGSTGDTSTANGDFETWVSGQPNNWSTSSTAGNATLSQSSDAHGGKYSVEVTGSSSANKRLGYKEMTLEAGDYTMSFYAKAATSSGASVRPGYVPVTEGKVGSYVYGDYTNDITNTEWVKVTHTFTISDKGTYCIVIMNSKNPGANVLIDDFTLNLGSTVIIK